MQAALPGEGDPITSLNASLDGTVLAVRRGTAFIQFIHLTSNKMFVQVLPSEKLVLHNHSHCTSACVTSLASCLMIPLQQNSL